MVFLILSTNIHTINTDFHFQRKLFRKALFMTSARNSLRLSGSFLLSFYSFFGGFAGLFRWFHFGVSGPSMCQSSYTNT